MHRPLHKMLVTTATTAVVILGLMAPATAQTTTDRVQPDTTTDVRPDGPIEVKPTDVRPDRPHDIAVIELGCEGVREGENLGAVCRWSSIDGARGYQLWRLVDRGHRELVGAYGARTTMARDNVPDDATLVRYAVLGLDADGETIGRSRVQEVRFRHSDRPTDVRPDVPVDVKPTDVKPTDVRPVDVKPTDVRPDRPHDVAVIELGCEGVREGENLGAVCRWSSIDGARGYQLWRLVDRGHRELVGTYNATTTMARDNVPDDATLVRYAVSALDADGETIGRSRVERIWFRHADSDRPVWDVRRHAHLLARMV